MGADFTSLPIELIRGILGRVRSAGNATAFLSSLLCCRTWLTSGQCFLYEDVCLKDHQVLRFLRGGRHQSYLDLIRCLSIRLGTESSCPSSCTRSKDSVVIHCFRLQDLKELAAMISQMHHLKAFTLLVDRRHNNYPSKFLETCFRRRIAIELVGKLSSSCDTLELDLKRKWDDVRNERSQFCLVLRRLLPQLKHVHLCLMKVCPDLLISDNKGFIAPLPSLSTLSSAWREVFRFVLPKWTDTECRNC